MSKEGEAAVVAYEALVEGDVDAALSWLEEHGAASDRRVRAWRLALEGCLCMTAGRAASPTVAELAAVVDDLPAGVEPIVGDALEWCSLAALVTFDVEALQRSAELAERVYAEDDPRRALAEAERALAQGELEDTRVVLEPLRGGDDAVSVRALCVDAIAASGLGAIDDATLAARTASRRARILRRRAYRYLAGLCLAQARRRSGRPHLAVRILSALEPLVPVAYRGWLDLEQIAVGQLRAPESTSTMSSPAHELADAVKTFSRAVTSSDRDAFDEAARRLEEGADFAPAQSYRSLAALLDPTRADVPDAVSAFLSGREPRVPLGLELLAAGLDEATWPVAVYRPVNGSPRRVVSAGLGLAPEVVELVAASRLRQGRTDVAAAVLALSADPMPEEAFFRETFGMRFVPPVHESVLAMTLSRVRKKLDGVAEIIRGRGEVTLTAQRSFAVPDPRCAPPPEGAVLRLIAQQGRVTARGAAQTLGVSLRTVQSAVRQLVSDGELELDRAGRSVAYRVDDTSFNTP